MAQQEGIIKLKGKVGDLSFYKTKEGYQARKKGGASAKQIKNDPRYQRTRENMAEFAEVCSASKRIRDILRAMIMLAYDPKMVRRLTARVYRMMKSDLINLRGERKIKAKSIALLKGFNFNEIAPMNNTLLVAPLTAINRVTGLMELHIPEISPDVHLVSPKGTSHFRIAIGVAVINLDETEEKSLMEMAASTYIRTTTTVVSSLVLNCSLPPNLLSPIVILMNISFYKEVNEVFYLLNEGVHNSLSVVEVDTN